MWQNYRRQVCSLYKRLYGEESGFTARQKIYCTLQAVGVTVFLGWFFYRSLKAAPFMAPAGIYYLVMLEEKRRKGKRERLRSEFREGILSIAANLRAGYAVENAFRESLQEMRLLYGEESAIYREFYRIVQGLANRISIETLMRQFAQRTKLEEIQEFADIFSIAKQSGGNLPEIIDETASVISEKIDLEKEIQVLLAAKKLEQNIMSVIPFAIVCYVSAASGGYFDTLYTTSAGRIVMTFCLIVYIIAYFLGRKITEIPI